MKGSKKFAEKKVKEQEEKKYDDEKNKIEQKDEKIEQKIEVFKSNNFVSYKSIEAIKFFWLSIMSERKKITYRYINFTI